MQRIDRLHLAHPFAGSRMLRDRLHQDGDEVGRRHLGTLMRRMGIEALYRKPNTSRRHPQQRIYPYLVRKLAVTRPTQAGAMDVTCIPIARGCLYLAAVVDWYSRRVLARRESISLDTAFCVDALEEALQRCGTPGIVNTDQGTQFASDAFTGLLKEQCIAVSMDGKRGWRDNVFVECLWKSVKYEEVYLRAYESVSAARAGLYEYPTFYNTRRPPLQP